MHTRTHTPADVSTHVPLARTHTHSLFLLARGKQTWTKHYQKIGRQVFGAVIGTESDVFVCVCVCGFVLVCVRAVHVTSKL